MSGCTLVPRLWQCVRAVPMCVWAIIASMGSLVLGGCIEPRVRVIDPCVSPDGRTVAFISAPTQYAGSDENSTLHTLQVAGRHEATVVSVVNGWAGDPVYCPDGRSLLLTTESDPSRWQISRVDLKTRQVSDVIRSPFCDVNPSVGPDGDTLAFVRLTRLRDRSLGGTAWCDADVWIGSLSRGAYRQLTRIKAAGASPPQFSPDGKRLYLSFDAFMAATDIYVVDATTGTVKKLTSSIGWSNHPAVSPDGSTVVFVSNRLDPRDYSSFALWTMRTDDSEIKQICAPSKRWQGPRFFPDGKSVVCWVHEGKGELWRIYLNGKGHQRLY